jgi:tetratricopeptide (TPR) repeat protein
MTSMRWRRLGGLAVAAALIGMAPASAQQSPDWTLCVNKNKAYPVDQAVKGCTNVLKSGRETTRNRAIAFNNRGIAYYDDNQYEKAIADFTEAIKLDRGYADAYQSRASAYSDNGDHDKAVADYNQAIRLNAKDPIAFNNRCDELLIIHQVQAAIQDCNESLRMRPNHANTMMHRGNALLAAKQYAKAIDDYDAVLRQNPKDAWSLYGRGFAKLKQGNGAGNADIDAAKAIQPKIAEGFESRGIK